MKSKDDFKLEKRIWSEADFEQMGWHDCNIYKMRMTKDLELDIDYILQWNKPDLEGLPFTFWVAPATLVFESVANLTFEFDIGFEALEIAKIEREESKNAWTVSTQQGSIRFNASGYQQYIRQEPFFQFGQNISVIERNGLSLERTTNQSNPKRNLEDVVRQREKDLEDFEIVKKRILIKQELEQLSNARENNEIDTKQYLLKKKKLNDYLASYGNILAGTWFERW